MNINEWCRKNDIWYLKMDLDIPKECIKESQAVYDEGFFVNHREDYGNGWASSALHGYVPKGGDISMGWHYTNNPEGHGFTEESVEWGWTELQEIAPETKRWLEDFPHTRYRRCRFMLLRPKGYISQHNDSNEKREEEGRIRNISSAINLAFYQPENCYLRRYDTKEELPFENCTGFWFDNGVEHEALNSSDENRFHFIIHGGQNKMRKELMTKAMVKQFGLHIMKEIDGL
tara:strand:- start:47 stop:739 length:693 start_codon:yes stop_codon:yes gene_type:complete